MQRVIPVPTSGVLGGVKELMPGLVPAFPECSPDEPLLVCYGFPFQPRLSITCAVKPTLICIPDHCGLSSPGGICLGFTSSPLTTIWWDGNLEPVSLSPKGQHVNKHSHPKASSGVQKRRQTSENRELMHPRGRAHSRGTLLSPFHTWPSKWSWDPSTSEPNSPASLLIL